MGQDRIGKCAQLLHGLRVIPADRRAGNISARHHQASRHLQAIRIIKQQHLDRRIGEHDTDLGIARRNRVAQNVFFSFLQQKDRLLVSRQDPPLLLIHKACALRHCFVAHHHRKRLGRAFFPFPKPHYRLLGRCVAAQMKSPDSFYGKNPSLRKKLPGLSDCVRPALLPSCQIDRRAAVVAAYRLGVIPAGIRILIFRLAGRTHGEILHARPCPVIRKLVQDRQPRAALGTVNEGMKIPAVFRVIKLPPAIRADRNIRGNENLPLLLLAFDDFKGCHAACIRQIFHIYL